MLHPISKIGNRQHNNADNHKVNTALLGNKDCIVDIVTASFAKIATPAPSARDLSTTFTH